MSSHSYPDSLFISGTSDRLFLNLELGCGSSCSYCYLPGEGLATNNRPSASSKISPYELLRRLESDARFVPGRAGSILSIGCFSECWDSAGKSATVQLINSLLPYDNWVQFATKRQIVADDLITIVSDAHWNRQVVAYVSSATLTEWSTYERGTAPPQRRLSSFAACAKVGVAACLYVKPVLPGVTVNDADLYAGVIRDYGVPCVVGDLFTTAPAPTSSAISRSLYIAPNDDVGELRHILSLSGEVFATSVEHLRSLPC